jgi:hypothetical protein
MRKIGLIFMVVLLLTSCTPKEKKTIRIIKDRASTSETYAQVEWLEADQLKALALDLNLALQVVEIESHHQALKEALDGSISSIDSKAQREEIIDEMVRTYMSQWRRSLLDQLLIEQEIELNEEDYDTVLGKTTYASAYYLLSEYEKIFYEKKFD